MEKSFVTNYQLALGGIFKTTQVENRKGFAIIPKISKQVGEAFLFSYVQSHAMSKSSLILSVTRRG